GVGTIQGVADGAGDHVDVLRAEGGGATLLPFGRGEGQHRDGPQGGMFEISGQGAGDVLDVAAHQVGLSRSRRRGQSWFPRKCLIPRVSVRSCPSQGKSVHLAQPAVRTATGSGGPDPRSGATSDSPARRRQRARSRSWSDLAFGPTSTSIPRPTGARR